MIHITADLLQRVTGCTVERAQLYAPHLDAACRHYAISASAERLAAFLAQVAHESGALRYVRELADGSAYEGRKDLGNTEPGDGPRYRGRGLIQTTGRANYRTTAAALAEFDAPDFEDSPEALEHSRWAVWSAAWYWHARGLNDLADAGDFEAITRRINGGLNGQADRLARWERARSALAAAATTTTDSPAPEAPPKEKRMPLAPIVGALLPSIIEAIPKLGKLFGSGSQVAERNVQAATMAVDLVQQAVGAVNAQDAAEKIKADPDALRAATAAIDAHWYELAEAGGGGIAGARKANTAAMESGIPLWKNPALLISIVLIVMPMMLVVDVLFVHPENYTGELRVQIVTAVLAVIAMISGYWIGTSFSSARKDERIG